MRFEIPQPDVPSYLRAANFLNLAHADVLCLQHEFGIYGGAAGSHILGLLRRQSLELRPDPRRVLLRPFMASVVVKPTGHAEASRRLLDILARVLMLDDATVEATLAAVLAEFHDRHGDIHAIFLERYVQPEHRARARPVRPRRGRTALHPEPARFVRFTEDNGEGTYCATYTAYNSSVVFPQIVATRDFTGFEASTLNGPAVRNKGLALFPRKVNGHCAMLGRQDGENIRLMFSDHPHFWYESKIIVRPSQPWEFTQLGNCGSPIETDAGWLVLTHGVGPMRKYCIGAVLLDRDDPSVVLGRLREPLLGPRPDEREGYAPNVVYTCGSLLHDGVLIIPHAVSDTATRFASMELSELLAALRSRS